MPPRLGGLSRDDPRSAQLILSLRLRAKGFIAKQLKDPYEREDALVRAEEYVGLNLDKAHNDPAGIWHWYRAVLEYRIQGVINDRRRLEHLRDRIAQGRPPDRGEPSLNRVYIRTLMDRAGLDEDDRRLLWNYYFYGESWASMAKASAAPNARQIADRLRHRAHAALKRMKDAAGEGNSDESA